MHCRELFSKMDKVLIPLALESSTGIILLKFAEEHQTALLEPFEKSDLLKCIKYIGVYFNVSSTLGKIKAHQ